MALDEIAFRPRVLRDVSKVNASVELFGRKLRIPVMLAPVGALETFDASGALPVVRGAGAFGAVHMLSSVCEPGLEAVAKAAPEPAVSSSSTCAATMRSLRTMSVAQWPMAMPLFA